MEVREVMTTPVVTVPPDAPYGQLVHLMLAHEISGLPVVDADDRLVGIVTEADLVPKEAYGHRRRRRPLGLLHDVLQGRDARWTPKAAGRTAADLMTADPVTIAPDADIAAAAQRMVSRSCKRLPVVEAGRVVGMVSRRDVLRIFERADGTVLADVARRLAARPTPEERAVRAKVVNGVVTLRGSVPHAADRAAIEAAVAQVDGVVGVESRLSVHSVEPDSPEPG